MTVRVPFGGGQEIEAAWPETLDPRDVYAGDELQLRPGSWESHRDFAVGEKLDREHWEALDRQFVTLFPRVLTGRAPAAELHALARTMGLDADRRFDSRHTDTAAFHLGDDVLADITENYVPDVGSLAPDRVLGPFADLHLPRRLRAAAAATLAFTRLVPPAVRPIDRYAEDKPRPDVALRAVIRAIALSPAMLWQRDGDRLRPMLPLAPAFAPDLPVRDLPAVPALLGRLVPLAGGGAWLAACIPLPRLPPTAPLLRRLGWEMWRVRRHELRITWEDLLRERGEVLVRTTLEWTWEYAVGPDAAQGWAWPD